VSVIAAMHDARTAEKLQALFYRTLAALAEDAGDAPLAERLNGLHADEQHHLSRLSARLVELGEDLADLSTYAPPTARVDGWEDVARTREQAEIARYETLLAHEMDAETRAMLEEFVAAERSHAAELGGKWMSA
jgi:rubrerythrin